VDPSVCTARSGASWLALLLIIAFACRPPSAGAQTDFNEDSLFDVGDVTTLELRIRQAPAAPEDQLELDVNRSGTLDQLDPRHLANVLIGAANALPGIFIGGGLGNLFITNQAALTFAIEIENANGPFEVLLRSGEVLFSGITSKTGQITLTDLDEGANLIELIYRDDTGTSFTRTLEVRRDVTPPQLSIESPLPDVVVQSLTVAVTGQAIDEQGLAVVTVNGVPMTLESDGSFHGEVRFQTSGPVALRARAVDTAGNVTRAERLIEMYVSPPDSMTESEVRIDLPAGTINRNGEEAFIDTELNSDIKALLGPETEGLVNTMPAEGLTRGIIIMPNAMMVSVETGVTPEEGLLGSPPAPMFANQPVISLQNTSGADNSMPLWIFQVIPDTDGDGFPELSLAARAKVAEDGPAAGRVVPIEPEGDDPLPGTFNPEIPVFTETTLKQVESLGSIQRLKQRMKAREAKGETPTARVTFYCCAASAVIPVKGKVRCGSLTLDDVFSRLTDIEAELFLLKGDIDRRTKRFNEAGLAGEDAAKDILGVAKIPVLGSNQVIEVPTVVNGKAFSCLKNFVTGGAAAIPEAIGKVEDTIKALDDIRLLIGQEDPPPPVADIVARLAERGLDYQHYHILQSVLHSDLTPGAFDDGIEKLTRIKQAKVILGNIGAVKDCIGLLTGVTKVISSWITIESEDELSDAEFRLYDNLLMRYKRMQDCKRHLIAVQDAALEGSALPGYLQYKTDRKAVLDDLNGLQAFIGNSMDWEHALLDLTDDLIALLEKNEQQVTLTELEALVDHFEQTLLMEKNLLERHEEAKNGLDAVMQVKEQLPVVVAQATAKNEAVISSLDAAVADRGGYAGASFSFAGAGAPFTVVSGAGGDFSHFLFTDLDVDPIGGENRMARLTGRDYTGEAVAEDGLYTGESSGQVETLEFPFTQFSTVDFDASIDIGDILLGESVEDAGGQAPTVQILFPPADFQIPAGFPVRVQTEATDDVAVLGVEVSVDGESQIGLPGGVSEGILRMPGELGPVVIKAAAIDPGGRITTTERTVQIVDAEGAFVIDPPAIRIEGGETQDFEALFAGLPASGVTWKVNGFPGGQPAVTGTIDAAGFYDSGPADFGGVAAALVQVSAELDAFPGFEASARVVVVDSLNVIAPPLAFSFPAPGAPGGLLSSRPLAFSFPAPGAPGGHLVSTPLAFSFPAPGAPGGWLPTPPVAFERQ